MKIKLLTAALLIGSAALAHAGSQDFTLVNQAGGPIQYLYISPSDTEEWGDDVLGEENTLPEGDQTPITFDGDPEVCVWDLKVAFEDTDEGPDEAMFIGVDLCKASKVTLVVDEDGDHAIVE